MRRTADSLLFLALFLLVAVTAACTRVHPHLSLPEMSLGEPSFFPTIEAVTGAPIVGGNAVEVLLNGEEIFPAMLEAIRSAQRAWASACCSIRSALSPCPASTRS